MINNIPSNTFSAAMAQPNNTSKSISQDKLQVIEGTLGNYDPDTLTEDDAISIVEAFKDAGIQPGRELAGAMSTFGFDAREIGNLAGSNDSGQSAPPPAGNQGGQPVTLNISTEKLEQLNELLNEYYSDTLSDEEQELTLNSIKDIFLETVPEGGLVNVYA